MENKQTLRALLLIIGGITQCLAIKQLIVMKGQTLTLTCRIKNNNESDHFEWRNPNGFLMFFNKNRALKDTRNEFVALTQSQYSISISDIKFKDGGVYKCLHYGEQVMTKRYKVIVLSGPVLEQTEHEDKTIIKCSASANSQPPRLSWLLENNIEIDAIPHYILENTANKHSTVSVLHVKTHKRRATVKCLAHYQALPGSPLTDFVHIGNQDEDDKTSPAPEYVSTTETVVTPTFVPSFSRTNEDDKTSPVPEYVSTTKTAVSPTLVPHFSSTTYSGSPSASETTESRKMNTSTISYNSTEAVNETTDSISGTTEGTPLNTTTDSTNSTTEVGNEVKDPSKRMPNKKGNSALLVLLVTCLIICLIVVLSFFLIRLRRAHLTWKQENEENDQSVESSRSKSSNDEKQKQNQQQRGRGIWNTSFTKYKVEEAAESGTSTTPSVVEVPDENPHNANHTVLKSCIRETEL